MIKNKIGLGRHNSKHEKVFSHIKKLSNEEKYFLKLFGKIPTKKELEQVVCSPIKIILKKYD